MRGSLRTRVLAGTLGTAALAVAAAGCGSNTETSSIVSAPTTQTGNQSGQLSKAEFVKQADAICSEVNSAINGLSTATVAVAGSAAVSEEAKTVKDQIRSLKALGTPSASGPQYQRYLAALQSQVNALEKEQTATDSAGAAATVEAATSNAQAAARALGLKTCAGGATPNGTPQAGSGTVGNTTGTAPVPTTATTVAPTTTTPTAVTPTTTPPAVAPPPSSGGSGTPSGGSSGGSGNSGGVGVGP